MYIGYARVSTAEQNLDLQIQALEKIKCDKIFTDKISGVAIKREGLDQAISYLRPGDTLVVWRLDRLGRSLKDLIQTVYLLKERGIEFASLQENIDTNSPVGKLIFHIFASLAEFDKDIISQRTKAGLTAARARGKLGGRPPKLSQEEQSMVRSLYSDRKMPVKNILSLFKISKRSLYRLLSK